MRKFNLVALSYDRDAILNALQRTNAVEVKTHTPAEGTHAPEEDGEELRARAARAEAALAVLSASVAAYDKEHKIKTDDLKDGFEVSYSQFMNAYEKREEAEAAIERIAALTDGKNALKAELSKTERSLEAALPYAELDLPFSSFRATAHTKTALGIVSSAVREDLAKALNGLEFAAYRIRQAGEYDVLAVWYHKTAAEETENVLQAFSFLPCPFAEEARTGREYCAFLQGEIARINGELEENGRTVSAMSGDVRMLKLYCDYLGYELEKAGLSEKMLATERTFLLEAYVPEDAEELVREALSAVTGAVYFGFSDLPADEMPPTLMKNNAVVKNFEAITNMYSPPNAKELDPSTVMAFFYSLFLGFIMGDIGYGLLMVLGGGFLYWKNRFRDGGLKRLAGVFAVGGVFAVVWGFLFNSLFGVSLPFYTVMPDAQKAMWSFTGIEIPAVLVIALEIGVVQLFAGYVCRAVQCWRRGKIWDGILDGVVWALFSVGVGLAMAGLVEQANAPVLAPVGGITAGAMLVIAIFTAGRHEKLPGKFTKGFGAAYGVINYASDILSYARLYGLMLSGAVIAQIISQYAIGFIAGGNIGLAVVGVLLMVVGHLFNLALNLLGAYIHDARLQYVEFYGRFYEGEGELFTPLGSVHKYVWVAPEGADGKGKNFAEGKMCEEIK